MLQFHEAKLHVLQVKHTWMHGNCQLSSKYSVYGCIQTLPCGSDSEDENAQMIVNSKLPISI